MIIGTPIISVKTLKDDKYTNILDNKNELSHKILTIKYNNDTEKYNIVSCEYIDTKPEEILAEYYRKMQNTFEPWYIDYDYDDIYTSDEVIVNNFDELSSIYSKNALETYKDEMGLLVFKDNGDVYITAGDITVAEFIDNIKFEDVQKTDTTITCNVVRTFRKSFFPGDEDYNEIYTKTDKFTITKNSDTTYIIEEFNYNNQ